MDNVFKIVRCSVPFLRVQMRDGLKPDKSIIFTSMTDHSTVIYHLGEWAYPHEQGTGLLCFRNTEDLLAFVDVTAFLDYYILECEVADEPMKLPQYRLDQLGGMQQPSVKDLWTFPYDERAWGWLPNWPIGTVAYPRMKPIKLVG